MSATAISISTCTSRRRWTRADFLARQPELSRIVHDIVAELDGSISAEHGIGQLRRDDLQRYKPAIELELMRRIKQALDPDDIMNPGKVI